MANKWRGGAYNPHLEPDGKVRQSQAASTFGPGAMIDLVHDAVVIGGLDFWRYDDKPGRSISEPRLRDAIANRLEQQGHKIRDEDSFRLPPLAWISTRQKRLTASRTGVRDFSVSPVSLVGMG
jgi:hypothetical protein